MIVTSGVLTPVAVALLIVGMVSGSLPVLVGAVAASVAASGFLVAAVRQRRAEFAAPPSDEVSSPALDVPFPPMAPGTPTEAPRQDRPEPDVRPGD
ncbi:MAG: hypothetical protein JWM93_2119 [Frankiales bacterium]|nr:hypothetical protein [Frankiales bacterium]